MTSLNVLIVDDSLLTQHKIVKIFEELGHIVVATARTGREAIDAYAAHKPDIVSMDITMPDMNGIEACKQICAEDAAAKIIMVTSHGQEQMVIDSLDAGAKGYIIKPMKTEKFRDIIEKVMG